MNPRFVLSLAALFVLSAANAKAGTLSNGVWKPSSACGSAPSAVQLDLSDLNAYNRSVDEANTYHKRMDVYLGCLVNEANSDIKLISQTANNEQQAVQNANQKLMDDSKAANEKFSNQRQSPQ